MLILCLLQPKPHRYYFFCEHPKTGQKYKASPEHQFCRNFDCETLLQQFLSSRLFAKEYLSHDSRTPLAFEYQPAFYIPDPEIFLPNIVQKEIRLVLIQKWLGGD